MLDRTFVDASSGEPLFSVTPLDAVLLIFMIALIAACYAIRRLENKPAHVATVILALAALVGALVPVVRLLTEGAEPLSTQVVAPSVPDEATPPAALASPSLRTPARTVREGM
ncbi:hypothetical protein [Streptomyces sp. S465]|uniref:hypothetical protein n=1 Tax=Streptomyces sp. S465 TaxID=2979468 RepID=UPI0022A86CDD|nr:hypothetical protein [Streptomyces sp. S465]WAP57023.1 hypothetical protein N6H00_19825 [Streptomyces sp. S465]